MEQVFQEVAEKCRKAGFVETVIEKAHYAPEDRELLWSVLERILACMEEGAAVSDRAAQRGVKTLGTPEGADVRTPCESVREVVMTLGKGVDELQDSFLSEGLLTEAYMVEVLGSEILLLAYGAYNAWVREHTDAVVQRYYFLGSGESFSVEWDDEGDGSALGGEIPLGIESIPDLLERSGLPVTCTEGFCMVPKKSVVFYAGLTKDKTVRCEGICMGCGRTDCPNRMSGGERLQGNRALDRPLTYGYARILGLFS